MSVVGTHGEAEIERPPTGTAAAPETPLRRLMADYFESRFATAAFVLLVTIIALALLAPLIVPQNPYNLAEVDVLDSRLPPGTKGMAGTPTGSVPTAPDATSSVPCSTACASRSRWASSPA